jgi:predicted ATPase
MLAVRGEALIKVLADRTGCMPTDWMMGSSQQFAGNQGRALEYAKNSVRNAAIGPRDRRFGLDRRNNALITSSRALWMLGFPEQALAAAHDVVAEARELNHAASLCVALHWMTSVSLWAGDLGMAEELIETLLERAETYSLAAFHDLAVGWNGALTLRRGRPEDAIRLFRTSLESLDAIRHRMMKTAFLAELAQALAAAGRREEGLAVIDEAIMRVEQTGEFMYSSEVLRIKGEILASDDVMAEEFLLRSLACAREQEALSWELRAATSLAGMRRRQGRSTEARAVLAPVYSRFGEGFDTADLMVAKRLLDEIA